MVSCKPARTPIDMKHRLAISTTAPLLDPLDYHRLVGKLIYLTITRSDLTYAVHILSQFMQAPLIEHLNAAKWILSYMKESIGQGLFYSAD